MALGELGSFNSPEIDRESDLLREIALLRAKIDKLLQAFSWIARGDGNSVMVTDDEMENARSVYKRAK
jgi:hypothetical protein